MRRAVVLLALVSGCGPSLVKYDELKDDSTIQQSLGPVKLSDKSDIRSELTLFMDGKGRHPTSWTASLYFSVERPKGSSDLLTKEPELALSPSGYSPKKRQYRSSSDREDRIEEYVIFKTDIDELVRLVEDPRLELNGKMATLNSEQVSAVRNAILAARAATNAGR